MRLHEITKVFKSSFYSAFDCLRQLEIITENPAGFKCIFYNLDFGAPIQCCSQDIKTIDKEYKFSITSFGKRISWKLPLMKNNFEHKTNWEKLLPKSSVVLWCFALSFLKINYIPI